MAVMHKCPLQNIELLSVGMKGWNRKREFEMLLVNIDALNVMYKETLRCFYGSRFVFINSSDSSVYICMLLPFCVLKRHMQVFLPEPPTVKD